jgi:hypothetical protein
MHSFHVAQIFKVSRSINCVLTFTTIHKHPFPFLYVVELEISHVLLKQPK